jgi:exodeoxyribonuclease VII large subunit
MEQTQRLDDIGRTMGLIINSRMQNAYQKIELMSRFPTILENRLNSLNQAVVHMGQMLNSLSYKNVLQRGFAIVRDKNDNIISTTTKTPASIEFSDGILKL